MISKKKIAIVGLGTIGTIHLKHLLSLQEAGAVDLIGLADPKPSKKAIELVGDAGLDIKSDFKDLLEYSPDGFIVATPTSLHATVANELLAHGASVLVEKPIALTESEAINMIDIAEKNKTLLRVGHAERFNPAFIHAMKYLPRLGELTSISSIRHNPYPDGRAPMGDVILDLGSHDIDLIDVILREKGYSLHPENINAIGSSSLRTPTDLLDNVQVFAQVNKVSIHISTSWVDAVRLRKLELIGTKGKLVVDLFGREVEFFENKGGYDNADNAAMMRYVQYGRREIKPVENVDVWPIELEQRAFIDELNGKKTRLATPQEGLVVLQIALKASVTVRDNLTNKR